MTTTCPRATATGCSADLSAAAGLDKCNLLATVGYYLPIHGAQETHSLDYHFHVDYEVTDQFFPLVEINGITYTRNANALPVNFEGDGLINLGATRVSGHSVMTVAAGARYRLTDKVSFGAAWEYPMTSRKDCCRTASRWTSSSAGSQ